MLEKLRAFLLDKTLLKKQELLDTLPSHTDISGILETLLSEVEYMQNDVKVGANVYRDVEFFQNFTEDPSQPSPTVFDVINQTCTKGGSLVAKSVLQFPLRNADIIRQRIQTIEATSQADTSPLAKYEKDMLWLFQQQEKHIEDLFNIMYFRFFFLRKLNKSPKVLTLYNFHRIFLSPFIGLMSPVIYFIIPFVVITIKFGMSISFVDYIRFFFKSLFSTTQMFLPSMKYFSVISMTFSLIFYFQGLFNSFEISRTLHKICGFIVQRFNGAIRYLKQSKSIIQQFYTPEIEKAWLATDNGLVSMEQEIKCIDTLVDEPKDFGLLNLSFGHQLERYKFIDKTVLASILRKTYLIDFIQSCHKFKAQNDVDFVKFQGTSIDMGELRHPCLDPQKVVKNDFMFSNKNIIVTGPNAGGKSTFIKSILINALICQTIGISTCSECTTVCFDIIHSQINIPDAKGHESLFEAEMHRCLVTLNMLKEHQDKHSLVVMDEIFNSTNPVEGISAAFAIAKKMSEYENCKLVFTTHYSYLTKLAKTTDRFLNYRMNVVVDSEGNMSFPYKISKGVSKQYIALELLKKNGFDVDIIEEAIGIKNRLCV